MWNQLRNEVIDRFNSVEQYFKATRGFKDDLAQASKGWAFVQIFSAYEFTVKSAMRTAIDAVNAHGHRALDLHPRLMALLLNDLLVSVRDCGQEQVWKQRTELFEQLCRVGPAVVRNTIFPKDNAKDGKQFRPHQLQLIFEIFGVNRPPVRMLRHLTRITELVEKRNSIAHGMETAENVGKRFTRSEISQRFSQVKKVCLDFIKVLETHCNNPNLQKRPS